MGALKTFVFFAAILAALQSFAEIKTPRIFSDNMVLQRDFPAKIWGTALPDANVSAEFAGQKKSVKADADGNWTIVFDKMPAGKKSADISIFENGKIGKKIANVAVGEVWILGGQSNMQFVLKNTSDYQKAKARANYPNLRYFKQRASVGAPKPENDSANGEWICVSPENLDNLSGTGFYFGERLMKDLNVPVGLVFAAAGGSQMIAWTPQDKIALLEYSDKTRRSFAERNKQYDYKGALKRWTKKQPLWEAENKKALAENKTPPRKTPRPNPYSFLPFTHTPSMLYNAVVAPIAGMSARGVLWYQGESDSAKPSVDFFKPQFELLINSWREKFGNDDLWFVVAELPSFEINGRDWPFVRLQQQAASKSLPKVATANLIDCGEQKDIHPKDKTTVGVRLEKIALNKVYGMKKVRAFGPTFKSVNYKPDCAEIIFYLGGSKLVGRGAPRGFEVKTGSEWKPANAELAGARVKITSADGGKIGAVRYLWKNWARPDVWLYNSDGLPATPFINEK